MNDRIIKECVKHGLGEHITEKRNNRNSYLRCKRCRNEAVMRRRKKVKEQLVAHFGGKCNRCGYNKCLGVLEFHHTDPSQKKFGIAESGNTYSFDSMIAEASKCELLCANCHREHECNYIPVEAS